MARAYPRFLFSNPQNTKSEGPFVVHTMSPYIIFKVVIDSGSYNPVVWELNPLNEEVFSHQDLSKITAQAAEWLNYQAEFRNWINQFRRAL